MAQWCRYNTLFHSVRFGYFLYNALSNVLIEIDEAHFRLLEEIRTHPEELTNRNNNSYSEFFILLKKKSILIDNEVEERRLVQRRHKRNIIYSDTSCLGLTICPTLSCNFRCRYCFEDSQGKPEFMTSATIEKLIGFVKQFEDAKHLSVCWYGGEPTLAFGTIRILTEKFLELELTYENASIVTNGYLLSAEKIAQLNELRIRSVQITLDGKSATHDHRRPLCGGGKTFERILRNVDNLMNSSYEGSCSIRINIDKENMTEYPSFRAGLLKRYKESKLTVHPARVDVSPSHDYDNSYIIDMNKWAELNAKYFHSKDVIPLGGFYPRQSFNTCVANCKNGYVIGPIGELYKCWEDVGKHTMVIGSIYNEKSITNHELVTLYRIATDPFDDEECINCTVFPICGGGCVKKRLRKKHFAEEDLEYCSSYKNNLIPYLEAYYDTFRTKELCHRLLSNSTEPIMKKGYRMVQPRSKVCEKPRNPLMNVGLQSMSENTDTTYNLNSFTSKDA